ncbi:uncharacterized protein LOC132313641 [Cornus florida]|uniref:uncharacterized protein LOC132313641 n=1 Tax=Cornus florida TaxID=4283 RepID=UPI00289DE78C|nr:uncharacterized protein LOC132313641 [Cornus florida]
MLRNSHSNDFRKPFYFIFIYWSVRKIVKTRANILFNFFKLSPMAETTNVNQSTDEEEDYMGDLSQFLPPETSQPPNPSSTKVSKNNTLISQSSNKKPKTVNWKEQRKLKREQKQEEEDKRTLVNLESAIPQSNIGFKMLKQMGYTPGSALGKEGLGRAQPVGLEIRRGRAGIGREDPRKEKLRIEEERVERKRRNEEEMMAEFGCRQKEQWRHRRIVVNFHKAKAVLAQLENKEVVEEEKSEEDGEDEDEEEEEITEEDLQDILMKLRDEYRYCLFCGCSYESMEALLSNCPGINEDDH